MHDKILFKNMGRIKETKMPKDIKTTTITKIKVSWMK